MGTVNLPSKDIVSSNDSNDITKISESVKRYKKIRPHMLKICGKPISRPFKHICKQYLETSSISLE